MPTPYLGEIRLFAGNFAPVGWALCNGQLLSISTNDALFALIGTTYGGDGQSTFALPNMEGRVPVHQGTSVQGITYVMGQQAGEEQITLTVSQMPQHTHALMATAVPGSADTPAGNLLANTTGITPYVNGSPDGGMNPGGTSTAGASQPHTNFQPYLCINFIIALAGIFPTHS